MSVLSADDKIALLSDLLDILDGLPLLDEMALDAFKRRGEMVLRNIYGDGHPNVLRYTAINFRLHLLIFKEGARERQWNEGAERTQNLLTSLIDEIETFSDAVEMSEEVDASLEVSYEKVFIVHGHDRLIKAEVVGLMQNLGLTPIVLRDQPKRGRTIIEAIDHYSDVSSAIVLLSPDDLGYSQAGEPEDAKPRARQNVILELGFFLGKLGRANVMVVHNKAPNFEMPSDYEGVIFIPYDPEDEVGGWKIEVTRELQDIGFDVDANDIL